MQEISALIFLIRLVAIPVLLVVSLFFVGTYHDTKRNLHFMHLVCILLVSWIVSYITLWGLTDMILKIVIAFNK